MGMRASSTLWLLYFNDHSQFTTSDEQHATVTLIGRKLIISVIM